MPKEKLPLDSKRENEPKIVLGAKNIFIMQRNGKAFIEIRVYDHKCFQDVSHELLKCSFALFDKNGKCVLSRTGPHMLC